MALHPNFPESPHVILDPSVRWFPADEALRDHRMDQLMPTIQEECLNRIVGDSILEIGFSSFLEDCDDICSYVKNFLAVHLKIDYVNAEGNISNYYPDFHRLQSDITYDYVFVDEEKFRKYKPKGFLQVLESFLEYKV